MPDKPDAKLAKRIKNLSKSKNATGRSVAYDRAVEDAVVIAAYHFRRLLAKYVDDQGKLLNSLVLPGTGPEPATIDAADALAHDLGRIVNLQVLILNIQRLRGDDALDITKNPLT